MPNSFFLNKVNQQNEGASISPNGHTPSENISDLSRVFCISPFEGEQPFLVGIFYLDEEKTPGVFSAFSRVVATIMNSGTVC